MTSSLWLDIRFGGTNEGPPPAVLDATGNWYLFSFLKISQMYSKISVFITRAGNSLIGFPSKSLVFCTKMSECAIRSKN